MDHSPFSGTSCQRQLQHGVELLFILCLVPLQEREVFIPVVNQPRIAEDGPDEIVNVHCFVTGISLPESRDSWLVRSAVVEF